MASPPRPHPPSQARALIQEAKSGRGRPLRELLEEAGTIADPSFAAEALMALSMDRRLSGDKAALILDDILKRAAKVDRGFRKAELLGHLAKRGAKWREGPSAAPARTRFLDGIVDLAMAMPPGQSLASAIQDVADSCPVERLPDLLHMALANQGFELDGGKAVAKAAADAGAAASVVDVLRGVPDAALRARLLGALHHHVAAHDPSHASAILEHSLASARRVDDPAVRLDVLRSLVASAESVAALHRIAGAAADLDVETRVRLLAASGGRADRLRDAVQARSWLEEGLALVPDVTDPQARQAIEANLRTGLQRLGGKAAAPTTSGPGPANATVQTERPLPAAAPAAVTRHVLALYDTYEGGLKDVHLRAIARAAPLCMAFDLDLALLGFPASDVRAVAAQAVADTNIGEGGRYLEDLVRAGRVLLVPCTTKEPPTDWTRLGFPVATTSQPAPGKGMALADAASAARAAGATHVCLVMGLGKRGLPASLLRVAPAHLELTGRGISMETATAMGVMAERLRGLPGL
ncbi:MAG: DUF531 family protein [bacterium]